MQDAGINFKKPLILIILYNHSSNYISKAETYEKNIKTLYIVLIITFKLQAWLNPL